MPSFGLKFDGFTGAVLKKARLLSAAGYNCSLVCMTHSRDFEFDMNYHRANKNIDEHVDTQNMFIFFADDEECTIKKTKINKRRGCSFKYIKKHNAYRIYDNGRLVESRVYDRDDNKIKHVNFYDNNKQKYRRDYFDKHGCISRSIFLDTQSGDTCAKMYYRRDGSCYLVYWYENQELISITWFDKNKSVKKVFKSQLEIQKYFLNSLVSKNNNFFISEKRRYDEAVTHINTKNNIYKIISHHGHKYPNIPSSFAHPDKIDAYVVLTEWYKQDIEDIYPKSKDNIFVIPNSFDGPSQEPQCNDRNLHTVISTSRYVGLKQVDHSIKSFRPVVDSIQDAKLELYGYGSEESKLRDLIHELGLENNVKLKGFAKDLNDIYSKAALSISTSKTEGFSQSTLESLALGCPVICYDVRYGQSDMIVDGENGFLVEKNNIKQMSDRIIESLSNKDLLHNMSKVAYSKAKDFSSDSMLKKWVDVFDLLKVRDRNN